MTELLIGLGLAIAALATAFFRGRSSGQTAERNRSDKIAREVEQRRVDAARREEQLEVDEAKRKREDQAKRPGVDRANDRLRRRGIIPAFVAALLSAAPALGACREDAGEVRCPRAEFDALMDDFDRTEEQLAAERARSKRLDAELAAAQDRSLVRSEPAPAPVGPVLLTAAFGVAAAAVAFVAGLLVGLGGR